MISVKEFSFEQNRMALLIRNICYKIFAGLILVVTVVSGAIAGLIGLIVRHQLPDTRELESAPKKEPPSEAAKK